VSRSAGLANSPDGDVDSPNDPRSGQIFAHMQCTRWQRNSPQPLELIAKSVAVSVPFVQGYKAPWSQPMSRQSPTTVADNKREGNGSGLAPLPAAMPPARSNAGAIGADLPLTQAARSRVPTDARPVQAKH
jgi:hypothetical protein